MKKSSGWNVLGDKVLLANVFQKVPQTNREGRFVAKRNQRKNRERWKKGN